MTSVTKLLTGSVCKLYKLYICLCNSHNKTRCRQQTLVTNFKSAFILKNSRLHRLYKRQTCWRPFKGLTWTCNNKKGILYVLKHDGVYQDGSGRCRSRSVWDDDGVTSSHWTSAVGLVLLVGPRRRAFHLSPRQTRSIRQTPRVAMNAERAKDGCDCCLLADWESSFQLVQGGLRLTWCLGGVARSKWVRLQRNLSSNLL